MVDIFVGSKRRQFVCHKDLLCARSPYFDRMFNGHLQEATLHSCNLQAPEDSAEGFEVFLSWLYRDSIPESYEAVAGPKRLFSSLASFCILADKLLLAKETKVQALDAIVQAYLTDDAEFMLESSSINSVLLTTAEDCPLRRLVVEMMWDSYAQPMADSAWLADCFDGVPVGQIAKMCQVLKDEDLFLRTLKADLNIFKWGKSIKDIERYQTGMLKVETPAD